MIESGMVLYTPPIQRLPMPVSPPAKDKSVSAASAIGAWKRGDPDQGRRGREARTLRQRLLDLVMEEVETIPGITGSQKQRIRRNLDRYATHWPVVPADPADGDQQAEPPDGTPPSTPSLPAASAGAVPSLLQPVILPPDLEETLAIVAPPSSDAKTGEPVEVQKERTEAQELAHQLRHLLSLHTDSAVKIATYLHTLMGTAADSHQIDLDI